MKKLLFLFFLFFISLNVSAATMNLPTPTSYFWKSDSDTPVQTSVTLDLWYGKYYYYGARIGDFGTSTPRNLRLDYNFNSINLCNGQELSLTGYLASPGRIFQRVSMSVEIYAGDGNKLQCVFTNVNENEVEYKCAGKGGSKLSVYVFENSFLPNVNENVGVQREITYSCDLNNSAIVEQSIANTQSIIQNENQNTNTIVQNQNTNTQNIINNQNQNTEKEIESQKVCSYIDKNKITKQHSYLIVNGSLFESPGTAYGTTDFIKINSNSQINVVNTTSNASSQMTCFYNINKEKISCIPAETLSGTLQIPTNSSYVRFSINNNLNQPTFEICGNGNQALNDSVDNLNDSIISEESPNTDQNINDMNDMVASDTPISDLITMPLTLINAYINGVNSSCSPVNLGNLYGTNLILPCINLEQKLGSNLWHIIDSFFSIFMCYNIGMLFITAFDGITSLRDDFEGLYQPKHADTGYQPKHGG